MSDAGLGDEIEAYPLFCAAVGDSAWASPFSVNVPWHWPMIHSDEDASLSNSSSCCRESRQQYGSSESSILEHSVESNIQTGMSSLVCSRRPAGRQRYVSIDALAKCE